MKFNIEFYKVSISEMILVSIISLIILNGFAFLIFTLIFKMPYIELFNKTWIILIFIPLFQGIIQSLINRNGLMTINNNNLQIINNKIENLLSRNGYVEISRNNHSTIFKFRSNWRKISSIINHKVIIENEENFVLVKAKRNILKNIESKIKWDKELNNKTENTKR